MDKNAPPLNFHFNASNVDRACVFYKEWIEYQDSIGRVSDRGFTDRIESRMLGSVVWDRHLPQGFERKELPELVPSFTKEDLGLFFNNLKIAIDKRKEKTDE